MSPGDLDRDETLGGTPRADLELSGELRTLERIAEDVGAELVDAIRACARGLGESRSTVAVVGGPKVGKSRLINRLCGADLRPVDAVDVAGSGDRANDGPDDGLTPHLPSLDWSEHSLESTRADGLDGLDGLDSADLLLFLVAATAPLSAAERRALVALIDRRRGRLALVLGQLDRLNDTDEEERIADWTRGRLRGLVSRPDRELPPCFELALGREDGTGQDGSGIGALRDWLHRSGVEGRGRLRLDAAIDRALLLCDRVEDRLREKLEQAHRSLEPTADLAAEPAADPTALADALGRVEGSLGHVGERARERLRELHGRWVSTLEEAVADAVDALAVDGAALRDAQELDSLLVDSVRERVEARHHELTREAEREMDRIFAAPSAELEALAAALGALAEDLPPSPSTALVPTPPSALPAPLAEPPQLGFHYEPVPEDDSLWNRLRIVFGWGLLGLLGGLFRGLRRSRVDLPEVDQQLERWRAEGERGLRLRHGEAARRAVRAALRGPAFAAATLDPLRRRGRGHERRLRQRCRDLGLALADVQAADRDRRARQRAESGVDRLEDARRELETLRQRFEARLRSPDRGVERGIGAEETQP